MQYKEPKFINKDGSLTAYSLACGYVQVLEDNWKLYQDGCYHLHKDVNNWLTFSKLTDARKAAKLISKGAN
jgi:hypothetical protein